MASRFGRTVGAWSAVICGFTGGLEALNPNSILQPGLSTFGRVESVGLGAVMGLMSGAITGAILGVIAATIALAYRKLSNQEEAPHQPKPPKPFYASGPVIAFVIGLVLSGGQSLTSPKLRVMMVSDGACSSSSTDLESIGTFVKNHLFQDASDRAQRVITEAADCADGNRSFYLGMAYFLRAGAQQRMQKDYASEAQAAQTNLADCAKNDYGDTQKQCSTMLVGAKRYVTQHFCDTSYAHSITADGMIEKNPQSAASESNLALDDASHCTNAFSYAYRGFALTERGAASIAVGTNGVSDLKESKTLLSRCISELTGAPQNAELLKNCQSSLEADNTLLSKMGAT